VQRWLAARTLGESLGRALEAWGPAAALGGVAAACHMLDHAVGPLLRLAFAVFVAGATILMLLSAGDWDVFRRLVRGVVPRAGESGR